MYAYMDLLERSCEFDVPVARAQAEKKNISARLMCGASNLSDRQFIKRHRINKNLTLELITKLTPHMPPTLRTDALDVETKVTPLRPTMMTPISDTAPDAPEGYYQGLHLTARSVVERCIGVLKARFRCLLVDRKLHYSPVAAAKIVNACCVLHNIAHRAHIYPLIPYSPVEATR